MNYLTGLSGLSEAWELNTLNYPSDLLPEFPTQVSEEEIAYCNGYDDAKSYMEGLISDPQNPEDIDYMTGWEKGLKDFFVNKEIFG